LTNHAIDLHNVSCAYDGTPVLSGVSLRIPPGQFAGMIGPSGAGKTTLLRAMLGLAPRVDGSVRVAGFEVKPGQPPAGVGYVPQVETVDWSFPVTVEQVALMGMRTRLGQTPWPTKDERHTVGEVLERLGIGKLAKRQIRDLSGGQQQRTFLARALVGQPSVLLLDEPTASVDIKTRHDILHLLVDLNHQGVTIAMTTHELNTVAAHLPWVVCVNGGIVAQGPPSSVFSSVTMTKTFNSEMRAVKDPDTGSVFIAEAGHHGPLDRLSQPPTSGQFALPGQ
jgi:zinc/manganese transport system ATP-binding protein